MVNTSIWQWYADQVDHYSLVRQVENIRTYEVVRVTHFSKSEDAELLHQVFFLDDFSDEELLEILNNFGTYTSMDDFRKQNDCGSDEEENWLIASLLAEHFDGRQMSRERADQLAKCITGI